MKIDERLFSHQSRIYALSATARGRVNSVYMAAYFLGGSLGSLFGGIAYDAGGFVLACTVRIAFSLAAHGVGSYEIRPRQRQLRAAGVSAAAGMVKWFVPQSSYVRRSRRRDMDGR